MLVANLITVVYTPSGGSSRCSSSMGYLEPRPPRPVNSEEESPSNSSNHGDQSLSPKEIQKQLLVKVQSLGPSCDSVEEESNTSASTSPSPQLPRSRSSQSLKSSGEASRSRGLSLGSLFRRYIELLCAYVIACAIYDDYCTLGELRVIQCM